MRPEAIVALLQSPEAACVRFLRSASGALVLGAALASSPGVAQAGQGYGSPPVGPGQGEIGPSEATEEVMGSLDRSLIADAVGALSPELKVAWTASQAYAEGQHGEVVVRFTLYADGEPTSASIRRSDLVDPAFHEAILQAFSGLELDSPGGTIVVVYPLHFAAAEAQD